MSGHPRVEVVLVAPVEGLAEHVTSRVRADSPWLPGTTRVTPREVAAALAPRAPCPVVLLHGSALTSPTPYGDLVADPRDDTVCLRAAGGRIVGLRVSAADRARMTLPSPSAATVDGPCDADAALRGALESLRTAGASVRETAAGAFPVVFLADSSQLASALETVDAVDDAALRLRRASRGDDGFLSTFLVRPVSRRVTEVLAPRGVRPATVTAGSLALGLAAAAAYGGGGRPWLVLGSALLLLSLVVDCVDGEIARYTRTSSSLGAWLDVGSDRVKELAVYAGLALGAARSASDVWPLALASLVVLVTRHFVDFGYAAAATASDRGVSSGAATDEAPEPRGVPGLSVRTDRTPGVVWAKRAVILPVGERTLLLVALVPVLGVRVALAVLLVLGLVAAAYTTAGRLGRTVLRRGWTGVLVGTGPARRLAEQSDVAPLAAEALVAGRAGWLLPAASRLTEQLLLLAVVLLLLPGAEPAAYAVLAVVALRGYDLVYRGRLVADVPATDPLSPVGAPVRVLALVLVVTFARLAWPSIARDVVVGVAVMVGGAAIAANVRWWRRVTAAGP